MMRTANLLFLLVLVHYLLPMESLASEPSFEWLAESDSETRTVAHKFFTSDNLPEEPTRVLFKVNTQIDDDVVRERVKLVQFYPTQSAIEQDGNGTIYWDQEIESLKIVEAGVLSSNKRYQRFQSDNYRLLDDDSYNTFTNVKKVVLPFSGLQAGDVSVLEYETTYKLSRLESNWSNSYYPVIFDDTLRFELSVKSNSIKLNSSVFGDRYSCDVNDYSLRCSADNLKAYQTDSRVVWRDVLDQIYVSSLFEWDQVIDHTLEAFAKAELDSEVIDILFERLTGSATTMEEKISRIQEYVARDIRYVSLSELGHRITPHTVASVEKNKFGDCKDKTALLVALLRRLGLDAQPYLVATKRDDPSKLVVPSGGYFDHMIACVQFETETGCIDGTDTDTNWQNLSSWIQGAVSLPLIEGAKPAKLVSELPRWSLEVNTTLIFDADGRQSEEHIRKYMNSYAGDMRSSYRPMTDEEKSKAAVDQYHQWVANSVEPSFTFKESDALSDRFIIQSTADYAPFLNIEADLDYTENDHWLRYELLESRIKTEHYDTEFEGLFVTSHLLLDVSSLWKPTRLPPELDLQGQYGFLTRTVTRQKHGKVKVSSFLELPRRSIRQSEIKEFNDYLELLASESSIRLEGELIASSSGD